MSSDFNHVLTQTEATAYMVAVLKIVKDHADELPDMGGAYTQEEKVEEFLMTLAERYYLTADVVKPGAAYVRETERRRGTRSQLFRPKEGHEFFDDIRAKVKATSKMQRSDSAPAITTASGTVEWSDEESEKEEDGRLAKRHRSEVVPRQTEASAPSVATPPNTGDAFALGYPVASTQRNGPQVVDPKNVPIPPTPPATKPLSIANGHIIAREDKTSDATVVQTEDTVKHKKKVHKPAKGTACNGRCPCCTVGLQKKL